MNSYRELEEVAKKYNPDIVDKLKFVLTMYEDEMKLKDIEFEIDNLLSRFKKEDIVKVFKNKVLN